jgi:hypothetical protein
MTTSYPVISENMHIAEYLVSEAPGSASRDVGVIGGAVNLVPGTVLGKITSSGQMVILNPAASDGSQNAAAILYEYAPIANLNTANNINNATVNRTMTVREAEVNGLLLTWPAGITTNQQAAAMAQLAAQDIIVRT